MKKWIAVMLLVFSITAVAAPDVSGRYQCKGYDPFAREDYRATLTVHKTSETYQFKWDFGRNEAAYIGTGFFANENIIAVTITSPKNSDKANSYNAVLQVYTVEKDGSLTGRWTFLGKEKVSPLETCVKQ